MRFKDHRALGIGSDKKGVPLEDPDMRGSAVDCGVHIRDSVALGSSVRLRENPRNPSIQILPTLGPKVCKYYLHWAIWIPRERSEIYVSLALEL